MVLGQLSNIDIRLLRVFRQIVESGGLSAAELNLNISRSVISRHLKDLETRLGGLELCRRGRAGFALTDEGDKVYREIGRLENAIDSFKTEMDRIHGTLAGDLVIATGDLTVTNPRANITGALYDFRQQAPDVTLHLHVKPLDEIEPRVLDETYHIGIVPMHRHSSCLDYHPLFDETMHLYCGKRHPLFGARHHDLGWEDLLEHHFAGLAYHSPNMELLDKLNLNRVAICHSQESIANLILSGCYLGFLPEHFAQWFVNKGEIQRIYNSEFKYLVQYSAILSRSQNPSRIAARMIECLVACHREGQSARNPADTGLADSRPVMQAAKLDKAAV